MFVRRCKKCGRKGLFLWLAPSGLCAQCECDRKKDEQKQANEAAGVSYLADRYRELQAECDKMSSRLAGEEKKLQAAKGKVKALYDWLESAKYAEEAFLNGGDTPPAAFFVEASEWLEKEPPLKCLTMKDLKAKYRKNEKTIEALTMQYQAQYTTKANAAIYKLMVMALQSEVARIMEGLSFGKLDDAIGAVKAVTAQYFSIAAEGNQTIISTLNRFIGQIEYYYIEAVKIEYEYYVQRERAKEEQRAIRERMRQEAAERRELEAQRKQVENEEKKYAQEMDRVNGQLKSTEDTAETEKLKARLAELEQMLASVSERKEEIIALQNGKAGTVYIISNIGSFGEDVFKVGMTRRLEPQDRVNELGDASVPFPFDVHSFIFSEDAVSLETALHKELNAKRVNKVNLRKEFFRVSLDELEKLVERIDPTAPFQRTMLAEQYNQSLSIDIPVESDTEEADEAEEA